MGVVLVLAAVVASLAAGSTQAASTSAPGIPAGRTGGYVPVRIHDTPPPGVYGSGNLIYHGGPVMHTNKTYAIYWVPSGYSVSANYKSLINRYFTDVAAASGSTSNVYSVETQYYDGSGNLSYNSTFGGSVTDTNPYPSSGCPLYPGVTKCLWGSQLITEINNVIAAQGWVKNSTTQFFVFTANNVGSCDSQGSCAYQVFCAYHGYSGSLIYANQPYAAKPGCDTDHPNGDDADATINVTSHEHREAINDFQLNAWYDIQGYEGSDKCAWTFGAALGGTAPARWNQVINGNKYWLQQEWSNDGSTCLSSYGAASTLPTISSFSPTGGPVGTSVTVNGTNLTGATAVTFNGTAASFTVNSSVKITATVPSGATTGTIAVTTPAGTATSAGSFTVTVPGAPTISSFTPTSGPVGTNVSIAGSNFTGATSVKFNGTAATNFTVNSSTSITATVPVGATTGKISVTTPNGTATSAGTFTVGTVSGAPTITSFSPSWGRRGYSVTINGTNFTGVTSVKLGGASASFTVNSSTRITAIVPTIASGSYKWQVTNAAGTATSASSFFVF